MHLKVYLEEINQRHVFSSSVMFVARLESDNIIQLRNHVRSTDVDQEIVKLLQLRALEKATAISRFYYQLCPVIATDSVVNWAGRCCTLTPQIGDIKEDRKKALTSTH